MSQDKIFKALGRMLLGFSAARLPAIRDIKD